VHTEVTTVNTNSAKGVMPHIATSLCVFCSSV